MRRCDGIHRREFLRVGSLSALGLSLTDALRLQADAGNKKPTNCILIWLDGGPSHLDTFDLKPDAPAEVRGPFRPIATNVPGIRICEHFQSLARHMDKVCLLRSLTSELGEHNFGRHYLLTGYKPSPALEYPSIGSVVAHLRGVNSSLPPYIAVPNVSRQGGAGYLPASAQPFAVLGDPSKPDFRVKDLRPANGITSSRLHRRRDFLAGLDALSRYIEENDFRRQRDVQFEQAYRLILSPAARLAFDLNREKPEVRAKYGRQKLGQSCLLARRLIEAGCPFVTVTDAGWDTHQQIVRNLKEGFVGGYNGKIPQLDRALSALLEDLASRGLLEQTLVVVMGEFGRTPKLNTSDGRDHWPRAFSVLLAGGGTQGGQVIGSSDARGESPHDKPITPTDLARTIFTLLGIDPDRELQTSDGRPVRVSAGGRVIKECF
ncbi:MAG: hypothetical protein KatS3mg105_3467 [Gemmatales bacterium]|nr:MAG: hypothetical protein KatS3mg105_3467 [Gemmatales bacterium]